MAKAKRKPAAGEAVALTPFMRAAEVRENSFDEDANTIEVVWAAGAKVRRYSWRDGAYYDEALVMETKAVRLGRMNAGAPFLDSHNSWSLRSVIGSVVPGTAKIRDGKGHATVKLSRAPEDAATVGKIKDGIIRNISVGYVAHRIEKTEPAKDGGVAEWRVLDWEPLEISAVPIPADPDAQVRSAEGANATQDARTFPCIIVNRAGTARTEQTSMDETETAERDERAENKRRATIYDVGRKLGAPDFAARHVEAGTSVADFRGLLTDFLAERNGPPTMGQIGAYPEVRGMDNPRFRAEAMAEAIACRVNPALTPSEPARQFVGLSLPEMAREHLSYSGVETRGLSRGQVVAQAFGTRSVGGLHSTSDFGLVLSSAVGRILRPAYEAAPSGLKPVARRMQIEDFRTRTLIALSGLSGLEKVNEHGEYKRATLKESGENVRLETFGKIFGITRQAIINDDLGAFDTLPRKFGVEAANFEAEQLAALLMSNPLMSDGTALFHASHGNLAAAGAAPSEARLSDARKALRKQTDAAGKLIGVAPRFLVVGPDLETDAEKLMTAIQPAHVDDAQPIRLAVAVEPRLTGAQWYVAADPAHVDGLVYAHLSGTNGPELETREGFNVDGIEIKVRLDFGCAFADWRGWFRNPGA